MQNSLTALSAEVRYRHRDLETAAVDARLRRAVRSRRFRWLTSRDGDHLRSDVAELITDAAPHDSPQWPLRRRHPRRAVVR
ncbi:MAG TPA: hypothetical protein VH333_24905 [Pseudonocardiaceae bacterium]|jgi:hypothetical protein|nr:hypothetical protein [Pseudonocardiaceae bacterium]